MTSASTNSTTSGNSKPRQLRPQGCVQPTGTPSSWSWNGQGSYQCASPDGDPKLWTMLNAYRSGGTEGVHWRYIGTGGTSGCLKNWNYYAGDGVTLLGTIALTTSMGDTQEWCALAAYRPGGAWNKQWTYCPCYTAGGHISG